MRSSLSQRCKNIKRPEETMNFNIRLTTVLWVALVFTLSVHATPLKLPHLKAHTHPKLVNSEDMEGSVFHVIVDPQIKASSVFVRPINNDSISPWEYMHTYDPNRIPNKISTARCLLTGCLNASGHEILEVESRHIYRQIQVLRRVSGDDKNYFFRLEYETIAVGCTCIRPYVQQI